MYVNVRTGIPDPSDMPPLCGEEEFSQLVKEVVANDAPRMFAIVAEYGTRADATCAAWGLAFETYAHAVSVDGRRQLVVTSPEDLLSHFQVNGRITARLVWYDPAAAGPQSTDDRPALESEGPKDVPVE
jgi:hypothetical protein